MTDTDQTKPAKNARRFSRLLLAGAAIIALGSVAAPRDAHAVFCTPVVPETPTGNAIRHQQTQTVITTRINTMQVQIVAAIDRMIATFMPEYAKMIELLNRAVSNQQSQSAQNQSALQTHAQQTRAAITGLNEEQVRREKKRMMQDATIAATPSATGCQVASASVSLHEAEQGTRESLGTLRRGGEGPGAGNGSIGRAQGGGRVSGAANAPRFSEEQMLEGVAPDADMAVTYAEFLDYFCNDRFEAKGACSTRTVDGEEFADRDIDPWESLFARSTLSEENPVPGDPAGRSYDQLAAESVITMLTQPIPPEAFPVEAVQNDVENRRLYVRQRANMARVGMAQLPLQAIAAQRDASVSGEWAKQILAKFEIDESDVPDEVSEYQMMEILMSQRFKDPDYWLRITGSEESVTLEEVAQLLAMQLMFQWEMMRFSQYQAGIQATELGMAVEGQQLRPNLEGIRSDLIPGPALAGGHGAEAIAFGIPPVPPLSEAALARAATLRKPELPAPEMDGNTDESTPVITSDATATTITAE